MDRRLSVSIPVDDDGFLRRECPICEREFKWRPTPEGEIAVPGPPSGYACPYCEARADAGRWWTKAQAEYVGAVAASEVLGPELKGLERSPDPDALISYEVRVTLPEPPVDLPEEPNDMRRIDFECHPTEPVKVDAGWHDGVHCIICGALAPKTQ